MLKKIICVCAISYLCVLETWGASTIHRGGTGLPMTMKISNTNSDTTKSLSKKISRAVGPVVANMNKSYNLVHTTSSQTSSGTGTNNNNVTTDDLNSVTDRITALENNMITDVHSENGNYVTDVFLQGNKLHVEKTSLLYVPVKNDSGNITSDKAEIWIVK